MANVTLSIPDEIRKKMNEFPEVNWSGLIRITIEEKMEKLVWKKEMKKRLKDEDITGFTDWTIEKGKELKKGRKERIKNGSNNR